MQQFKIYLLAAIGGVIIITTISDNVYKIGAYTAGLMFLIFAVISLVNEIVKRLPPPPLNKR